jgi:hypothetical protein
MTAKGAQCCNYPSSHAHGFCLKHVDQALRPRFDAPLSKGDYVLATKYEDGDPHDGWCVGFYECPVKHRHRIINNSGQVIGRWNGFEGVVKISRNAGQWILDHQNEIQSGSDSLWVWLAKAVAHTSIENHVLI